MLFDFWRTKTNHRAVFHTTAAHNVWTISKKGQSTIEALDLSDDQIDIEAVMYSTEAVELT